MRYEINEWTKELSPKTFAEGRFYLDGTIEQDVTFDNTTIYESQEEALRAWKDCQPKYTDYGNAVRVKCYELNEIDENGEYVDSVEISDFEDLVFEYNHHDMMWHAEKLFKALEMDPAGIKGAWEFDHLTDHIVEEGYILHYFDGVKEGAINMETDEIYLEKDAIEELGVY